MTCPRRSVICLVAMSNLKQISRRLGFLAGPFLGSFLLNRLLASCRWQYSGREPVDRLLEEGKPFIGVTWHYDLISVLYHFRHTRSVVMVSRSTDGELVARMVKKWGFQSVRGSKHKGGLDASRELITTIRQGRIAGLVADGSQGPAHRVQKGAVFIARATQAPLIPCIVTARKKIRLNTWDRTQIPLPFTDAAMYFGPALMVPPKSSGGSLEQSRRDLQQALDALYARAENHQW